MLADLRGGNSGLVTTIKSGNELVKRLAAMGIVVGSAVKVISNSGSGPILVESEGRRVAMGQGMAMKIGVEAE